MEISHASPQVPQPLAHMGPVPRNPWPSPNWCLSRHLRIRLVSTAASVELQRVLRSEYLVFVFSFRCGMRTPRDGCQGNSACFSRTPSCRVSRLRICKSERHPIYDVEQNDMWTGNGSVCYQDARIITHYRLVLLVRVNWQPAQKLFIPCAVQPGRHWLLPGRRCA